MFYTIVLTPAQVASLYGTLTPWDVLPGEVRDVVVPEVRVERVGVISYDVMSMFILC